MIVANTGWPDLELLKAAPILIWRAGLDAKCNWFNPAWLAYTGRTMEQEMGDGWTEGVHPGDFDCCLEVYLNAFALRQPFDMEYRIKRACGEYGWIADYGIPILNQSGEFLGYVGYCFDISTRRQSEEKLEIACKDLAASNAELEQFAYVASHDLREPLRMISSYVDLIERRYGHHFDGDGHEFIGFVRDGARRMDAMVLDLLAFSRIDRQGEPLVPMRIDDVISHAVKNLGAAIAECDAHVVVDVDASLMVVGDGHQLDRLFQNLIGNAIKYRQEGVRPHIAVMARPNDGKAVFSVQDNGIGIAPEYFDRIFLLFQRLHTRDAYEGTGIGLSVCKKIVERHGGEIWVEQSPSGGSTFLFTLPTPE